MRPVFFSTVFEAQRQLYAACSADGAPIVRRVTQYPLTLQVTFFSDVMLLIIPLPLSQHPLLRCLTATAPVSRRVTEQYLRTPLAMYRAHRMASTAALTKAMRLDPRVQQDAQEFGR